MFFIGHFFQYFYGSFVVFWQKNLVGRRGLMPDTDQQTFRIAVQHQLRTEYNRILMPITTAQVRTSWCSFATNVRNMFAKQNIASRFLSCFLAEALCIIEERNVADMYNTNTLIWLRRLTTLQRLHSTEQTDRLDSTLPFVFLHNSLKN